MSTLDRVKLAAVLGMLGSAHEGEVLSAARQAERIRRDAGATWQEIVGPAQVSPRRVQSIAEVINCILDNADLLTDWEFQFIQSIRNFRHQLSPKQLAVLERLVEKCRANERAA